LTNKLISRGHTGYDLAMTNTYLLKKNFNVVLMRTAMELQGIACGGLEEIEPKQNIMSFKSLGQMQTQLPSIEDSVSSHCARAVEKMRRQHLICQRIMVFVHTNDLAQHFQSIEFKLINPRRLFTKKVSRKTFRGGLN
jgi:DNA polymerase V